MTRKRPPPPQTRRARRGPKPRSAARPQATDGAASARLATPELTKADAKPSRPDGARFPVVGLGASAGGLAALEQFFQHLPNPCGMAFMVITHQAPDRVTLLPELLAKRASISVTAAVDGEKLKPDHAYVAPPGCSLAVQDHGVVSVVKFEQRGPLLPIDHAFRSLAHSEGDHAIGIVLSGSGSDGTLGITEIKSSFGMVMAQEPESAQYAGMPASAIATQLVDYVSTPERMPEQLIRYVRGRHLHAVRPLTHTDAEVTSALARILHLLRARTGSDFSAYKRSTIKRRIERRMHVHGITDAADYALFVEHTAYEIDALFKELLISVTSFFRDPTAFEALEHALTDLIDLGTDQESLRVWVPGCATGEEAYSIAILVKEALDRSTRNLKVQIFATDLDQQAVDVARAGRYPQGIAADLSAERLKRFFAHEESGYRVNKDVRDLIVFAVQNLIKDPPFTKLDLISCRNVMIYLETDLQKRVLGLFSYALRPGGFLLLGTSESVSGFEDRFAPLDTRWKLFRREQSSVPLPFADFPPELPLGTGGASGRALARDRARTGFSTLAERVLLSSFVPATVIMSERGELAYVHGRIGMFLEPAPGEPTHNAFNMAREGLRLELSAAVRQAAATERPVVRRALQVKTNGGFTPVCMRVRKLNEPEALRGAFVVSFELEREADPPEVKQRGRGRKPLDRIVALDDELKRTRESLHGTTEELETANEELKSTNEELQSTNEELQSANEELETSREEMQALNEELQTVNSELEERNRALSQTNDDMQNLLNSTGVATVFLDDKLNIKRFTTQAKKVFRLIETDIGRPLSDLAANLRYDALLEDAQEVLRTLVFREREIQTKEGSWRQMRMMPYRTHDNLIDGLVMTFFDIDRIKRAERTAQVTRVYAESIIDALHAGVLVLDAELCVVSANYAFHELFGTSAKHVIGATLQNIANKAWDQPKLLDRLRHVLETGIGDQLEVEMGGPRSSALRLSLSARPLPGDAERPKLALITIEMGPTA